jgi:hypothetical protein
MRIENSDASDISEKTKPDPSTRKLSTGPRTDAGKRRSGRNSIRYGIFATCIFIGDEAPARYYALARALETDLGISGATEKLLVDKLVANLWRQARLYRAEGKEILRSAQLSERFLKEAFQNWTSFGYKSSQHTEAAIDNPEPLQVSSSEIGLTPTDQLANLMTYERHLGREIDRIFDQLERVRRFKKLTIARSSCSKPSSIRK